jgi:hypothetical protein
MSHLSGLYETMKTTYPDLLATHSFLNKKMHKAYSRIRYRRDRAREAEESMNKLWRWLPFKKSLPDALLAEWRLDILIFKGARQEVRAYSIACMEMMAAVRAAFKQDGAPIPDPKIRVAADKSLTIFSRADTEMALSEWQLPDLDDDPGVSDVFLNENARAENEEWEDHVTGAYSRLNRYAGNLYRAIGEYIDLLMQACEASLSAGQRRAHRSSAPWNKYPYEGMKAAKTLDAKAEYLAQEGLRIGAMISAALSRPADTQAAGQAPAAGPDQLAQRRLYAAKFYKIKELAEQYGSDCAEIVNVARAIFSGSGVAMPQREIRVHRARPAGRVFVKRPFAFDWKNSRKADLVFLPETSGVPLSEWYFPGILAHAGDDPNQYAGLGMVHDVFSGIEDETWQDRVDDHLRQLGRCAENMGRAAAGHMAALKEADL